MYEYEGDKDYIFVSYSHKDEKQVLQIIERLCNDGYRVWYDAGIEVGSEWPETIATHLMNCSLFIAFVSADYMDSFNCKREIDYAVSKRKHFIAVWLEQVKMSPGMEMQLSSVQSISWNPTQEEQFYRKLYKSGLLDKCREEAVVDPDFKDAFVSVDTTKVVAAQGNGKIKKLLFRSLIALVVVIVLGIIASTVARVRIAGVKISRFKDTITIRSKELTEKDIKNITKLRKLKYLTFEECTFPENASKLLESVNSDMAMIHLLNNSDMADYSWISDLAKLSTLEISGCGLTNDGLSTIDFSALNELRFINFSGNAELSSIDQLSVCHYISELNLEDTAVYDLSVLADKEALDRLNISRTGISDLSVVSDFTGLLELYADDDNLTALSGLEDMTDLNVLQIKDNNLTNLDGADSLYKLKTIVASGNNLTSVDGLSNCTQLETIDLSKNELEDISAITKSVATIKKLDLSDNKFTDLSYLKGMTSLKNIAFDNNGISDLSFLSGSTNLDRLSANGNAITSLESIYGLDGLEYLYVANNRISGLLDLNELPELREVMVQHNSINEIIFNSDATEQYKNSGGYNRTISVLAAYDNPLFSIKDVGNGANEISTGYISFPSKEECIAAGYEYNPYSFRNYFHDMYVSDCPFDERLQFEEAKSYPKVEYTTNEYMDELLEEKMNGINLGM